MTALTFTVAGNPIPWKRARSQGKRRFNCPEVEAWKKAVRSAAYWRLPVVVWGYAPWPSDKTYRVSITFYRKDRTGTDLDRLVSAVLDGMEGIVYAKDRQVTEQGEMLLRYDRDDPRAEVRVDVVDAPMMPKRARRKRGVAA